MCKLLVICKLALYTYPIWKSKHPILLRIAASWKVNTPDFYSVLFSISKIKLSTYSVV